MRPDRVVVVGASVAGVRAAQALRSNGFDGDVTVVGAEGDAPYDKPPLSKQLLTGESAPADIGLLRDGDELDLRLGRAAARLDPGRGLVILDDGEPIGYDVLIIATGVRARTLPGADEDLITTVRDLRDATTLRSRLASGEPVVVIGGGFIGAEVAAAATAVGCPVTLVEQDPVPFSRVLRPEVGRLIAGLHEAHGVTVIGGASVAQVERLPDEGALVRLADGRVLPAGTVVAGVGCAPNTEWLAGSGLPVADGVLTDDGCALAGAEGIYAIGDVARWRDPSTGASRRVEHWTNAVEQANFVARQIVRPGEGEPGHYASVPYFWSDQYDVKIQMVGRPGHDDNVQVLRYPAKNGGKDVALYERSGKLTAAVTFGWPRASVAARQAWQRGADAVEVRATLAALTAGPTAVPTEAGRR